MVSFKDFCKQVVTNYRITSDDVGTDMTVPPYFESQVESLIEIMRPKMNRLDRVSVRFIEEYFENIDKVPELFDTNRPTGDVPNSIINKLSTELYGKPVNDLTDDEQAIIKVLSCYICIQN